MLLFLLIVIVTVYSLYNVTTTFLCTSLQALKDPTPLLKAASTALALKTKASVKDRSKVRPQDLNNKVKNCV